MSNKSGINATNKNRFYIGDGTSGDGYIYIDRETPNPYLRHNSNNWVFSNDGSTEINFPTIEISQFSDITVARTIYPNNGDLCWIDDRKTLYQAVPYAGTDDGYVFIDTAEDGYQRWVAVAGQYGNVAVYRKDGYAITGTTTNIYLGKGAMGDNADSRYSNEYNVIIGKDAGKNLNGGTRNTGIGYQSLETSTTSTKQVAIGNESGRYSTSNYGVFVGSEAGKNITGDSCIFLGPSAGMGVFSQSSGSNNIGIGNSSLNNITTGGSNICIGLNSGRYITTSDYNVIIGYGASSHSSQSTITGQIAIGHLAAYENTNDNIIAIGYSALNGNTGNNNVGIGTFALQNSSGNDNIAIGRKSGNGLGGNSFNVSIGNSTGEVNMGNESVAIGYAANYDSFSDRNVSIGYKSGYYSVNQTYGINIGYESGYFANGIGTIYLGSQAGYYTNTISNYNIGIGYQAMRSDGYFNGASNNIALGYQSAYDIRDGDYNFYVGYQAGANKQDGSYNVGIGYLALSDGYRVSDGVYCSGNIAIGNSAGRYSLGDDNTFLGTSCGKGVSNSTTGNRNVAIGKQSLYGITTGNSNVCLGPSTGYYLTTGDGNVHIGSSAGYGATLTATSYQVSIGYQAGLGCSSNSSVCIGKNALTNNTGSGNVGIGSSALQNGTGNSNTAVGAAAGAGISSSIQTVAVGYYSGINAIGSNTVAVGYNSGNNAPSSNYCVIIGSGAGRTIGQSNVTIGYNATGISPDTVTYGVFIGNSSGYRTSGIGSIYLGYESGYYTDTNSNYNIGIGYQSMECDGYFVGASNNIALGYQSAQDIRDGDYNVYAGYQAGTNKQDGSYNIGIGYLALADGYSGSFYSDYTVAIGSEAGRYSTGDYGTFIGNNSGKGVSGQSSGSYNTALGYFSLQNFTTGSYNTCLGNEAGKSLTVGHSNTFIGYQAASHTTQTYQSYKVAVGYRANYQSDGYYTVSIGYKSGEFSGTNTVAIGSYASASNSYTATNGVSIGYYAGFNDGGDGNVSIGKEAGYNLNASYPSTYNVLIGLQAGRNASGDGNVYIGGNTGYSATNGSHNLSIGYQSMECDGYFNAANYNISLGFRSLQKVQTGWDNLGIGRYSLRYLTTGNDNISYGRSAGSNITTGSNNICIGKESGTNITTDSYNICIGENAGSGSNYMSEGINIGHRAGLYSQGMNSIHIGTYAGYTTQLDGYYNIAIGYKAMYCDGYFNGAQNNIAIGYDSLRRVRSGTDNIALGKYSLDHLTSGINNVGIGLNAGTAITDGYHNTIIGINSSATTTSNYGIISIGYESEVISNGSIAIGYYSKSTHLNSLTIGFGSSPSKFVSQGDYTATLGYKSLYLGRNINEDITLFAHNGDVNKPYIKYSAIGNKWIGSNNGLTEFDLNSGGGGTSDHNLLTNLQGGEADGYYHLTPDQHTWLTDGYVDGYWNEIKGGTGQTSYTTGDILYADGTNSLTKLPVGTASQILKISGGGLPTWQDLVGVLVETATENVAGGTGALASLTTGDYNTAFGYNAGNSLNIGIYNVLMGRAAGGGISSGSRNIILAGGLNVAPNYNGDNSVIIGGSSTGKLLTSSSNHVIIGHFAGENLTGGGDSNTFIGSNSGEGAGSSCTGNTALGRNSLGGAATSNISFTTAIGYNSLDNLTGVTQEVTAIGYESGAGFTSGVDGVFIGAYSGATVASSEGTALGYQSGAGSLAVGVGKYGVGSGTGSISIGSFTTATHTQSLVIGYGSFGSEYTSQGNNTASFDYHSLYLGRETDENITFYAHNGDANKPYLRYDSVGNKWIGSDDGTTEYDLQVSGGTTDHNALTNLQGGEADGYYHLTPGEHQFVVDGYDNGSFTDGYQLTINGADVVWEPGYYNALFVGKIGAVAASTDGYLLQNLSISNDENFPAFITPIQSHAAMMIVKMSQAPGAGESVTVTLRKDGADTALSVTVSDTSTANLNTTTLVSAITASSSMTVRVQTTSGAAVQDLAVSLLFYPDNAIF